MSGNKDIITFRYVYYSLTVLITATLGDTVTRTDKIVAISHYRQFIYIYEM